VIERQRIALLTGAAPIAVNPPRNAACKFGRTFLPYAERLLSTLEDPNRMLVWIDDAGEIAGAGEPFEWAVPQ
jgi:hypothetical protein